MIAKARAYLGSEAALNAVKSVHYVGSMVAPDVSDPKKSITVALDIIFQAPYRERTTSSTDTLIDTNALDSYDGWHRIQDPKDLTRVKVQLLATDQVRRQRAIAWENLGFFRGLEQQGGHVLDQGQVTVAGVVCRKLAFVHSDNIIFYRYFDEATGRLTLTETESGSAIREQGEIMVNGVRFPKVIVNSGKDATGQEKTVTITFDRVTINEDFPASVFALPSSYIGK